MKTQCQAVLNYIIKNGSITDKEAREHLYINRLAARVFDLKFDGVPIVSKNVQVTTPYGKTHITMYSLPDEYRKGLDQ